MNDLLDTPVVSVLLEERMLEKELGIHQQVEK
jgi:hypothetical protein